MLNQKDKIQIYTKDNCPYCINAKSLLDSEEIDYSEIKLAENSNVIEKIKTESRLRTFPIIMINDKLIGGYSDLKKIKDDGILTELLKSS